MDEMFQLSTSNPSHNAFILKLFVNAYPAVRSAAGESHNLRDLETVQSDKS